MKEQLFSSSFTKKFRSHSKAFTRNRKLSFQTVFLLILRQDKVGNQQRLDRYVDFIGKTTSITAGALTRARKKLLSEAFIFLNRFLVDSLYQPSGTSGGITRILAIDGSKQKLPDISAIGEEFGRTNNHPSARPMALASGLFDVVNKLVVDAVLARCSSDENRLAHEHLAHLGKGDLVILDRGYKSHWLMCAILLTGADFLIRLPINSNKKVDEFLESGLREQVVIFEPSKTSMIRGREMEIPINPIRVRLVRVSLKNGGTEILVTSLIDDSLYPHSIFRNLYALRWGIEEQFKFLKSTIQVEAFSGKTPQAIFQEFHAAVLLGNMQAIVSLDKKARKTRKAETAKRKYDYKENRTQAVSFLKTKLYDIFLKPALEKTVQRILEVTAVRCIPIRKNRSNPRDFSLYKTPKFPMNKAVTA